MLSAAASNALLKTLEEPPPHVVFVLATTDPQKVLPTIRSRTQHYEFRLISAETLAELTRDVAAEAGLKIDDGAIDVVARRGAGSARDALSALDQVAASGGSAVDEADPTVEIVAGLAARDAGAALVATAKALASGRDARRIGESLLARLRTGFLALLAPDLDIDARDDDDRRAGEGSWAPPGTTRALEVIGDAVTSMKEAVDARVALETALVRVAPHRPRRRAVGAARAHRQARARLPKARPRRTEPLDARQGGGAAARGGRAPAPAAGAAPVAADGEAAVAANAARRRRRTETGAEPAAEAARRRPATARCPTAKRSRWRGATRSSTRSQAAA